MTDDEIDRAIAAVMGAREYALPIYSSNPAIAFRAIYRAGYAAGLEAAAKVCAPVTYGSAEFESAYDAGFAEAQELCAAAIRALKD